MAGGRTYVYVEDVIPNKFWALAEGPTTIIKRYSDNERVAVVADESASYRPHGKGKWNHIERGDMKIADFVEKVVGLVQ